MMPVLESLLLAGVLLCQQVVSVSGAECGHPGEPAGGSLVSSEVLFYPGEEVSFTCQPGHILAGPERRHCREDGTWSGSLPSCSEYQHHLNCHTDSRKTSP